MLNFIKNIYFVGKDFQAEEFWQAQWNSQINNMLIKKLDGIIGEEFPVRFCFQGHGAYFDFQKVFSF